MMLTSYRSDKGVADRRRFLAVMSIAMTSPVMICEGRGVGIFQVKSFAGKSPSGEQFNVSPSPRSRPILQSGSTRRTLSHWEVSRASDDSRVSKSGKASKTSKKSSKSGKASNSLNGVSQSWSTPSWSTPNLSTPTTQAPLSSNPTTSVRPSVFPSLSSKPSSSGRPSMSPTVSAHPSVSSTPTSSKSPTVGPTVSSQPTSSGQLSASPTISSQPASVEDDGQETASVVEISPDSATTVFETGNEDDKSTSDGGQISGASAGFEVLPLLVPSVSAMLYIISM